MTADSRPPASAWQPLTPGGVAAFAGAGWGRMLGAQLVTAVAAAACLGWVVAGAWFPVVARAIDQLPDRGSAHEGQLDWSRPSPVSLAANPFLSIIVDLNGSGEMGQTADLQWAFGRTNLTLCSLLGCLTVRYPAAWRVPFNRTELEPWWGAWHPAILLGLSLAAALGLLSAWSTLALLYALPARLLSFFLDRAASPAGCWRLSVAAQLPGAFLMTVAIALYGLQRLAAASLLVLFPVHVVIAWIYVLLAIPHLPRLKSAAPGESNPFAAPSGGTRPRDGTSAGP